MSDPNLDTRPAGRDRLAITSALVGLIPLALLAIALVVIR